MAGKITWEQLGTPDLPVVPAGAEEPKKAGPITFEDIGTPPEGYEPPSAMQEVLPSISSGAAQGAMGVAGLPGALTYYTRKYAEEPVRRILTGEQATEDWKRGLEEGMPREQRQAIAEGSATPFRAFGQTYALPTMQGMDVWGKKNIPGYEYEPTGEIGKSLQTGANFGVQSLVGGPKGVARRVATGVGAGAGAEQAGGIGEALGGSFGKVLGEVGGAMAADFLSHKVIDFGLNIGMTSPEARKQLADAIAQDFAADPAMQEQLRTAVNGGDDIYLADFLQGEAARKLLAQNYSPKQQVALQQLNKELEKRANQVQDVVDTKFAQEFGRDLREADFATSVKEANDLERGKLYTDMKALPGAQSVMSNNLIQIANSNGYVRDAINNVNKMFMEGKIAPSWNVMPPMGGMAPNIQYWDLVKREIDHVINTAKKGEGSGNVLAGADAAKKELVKELDTLLPEYGTVRNQAAEMFGAENSLEGGYKMAQALASGSPFKVGEFMQNYGKLTSEQKKSFAEGAARSLLQRAKGDMSGLINYMENPNVQTTMRSVLGDARFDGLYAKAISANLMSNAQKFDFIAGGTGSRLKDLAIDVAGGVTPAVGAAAATGALGVNALTGGALALGAIAGVAMNASERKVANRVVELAFSRNPKDAKAFAKLLRDDYDAVSVVRKLGDYMQSAVQKGTIAYLDSQRGSPVQSYEYAPPMKSGGRIHRKSGGRIGSNPISAEVRRVRTLLSEKTASMLSIPDDAIATALNLAKGNA